jgi:hypothetical protein
MVNFFLTARDGACKYLESLGNSHYVVDLILLFGDDFKAMQCIDTYN